MTKRCVKCNSRKHNLAFGKSKTSSDGLESYCKECKKLNLQEFRKTKDGVLSVCYSNQKQISKRRNHTQPNYTLAELKEWVKEHEEFDYLFDNWVFNNYDKDWKPSFDRLDDYKPYALDNLQVITWQENNDKGNNDMKDGVNNKQSVEVEHNGKKYYSLSEASRQTGWSISYIKVSSRDNKNGWSRTIKNWYEDESNFPAPIIPTEITQHNGKPLVIAKYYKGGHYYDLLDKRYSINGWRLATKQEVEALHYDGKDK